MLSPSRFIGWRAFPVRVGGGRLVMKTRPGLLPRSRRAENRYVPWLDATDYRHSSCLAGDVDCENLRLGLLRQTGCSLCRRLWTWDRLLFSNGGHRGAKPRPIPERSRSKSKAEWGGAAAARTQRL